MESFGIRFRSDRLDLYPPLAAMFEALRPSAADDSFWSGVTDPFNSDRSLPHPIHSANGSRWSMTHHPQSSAMTGSGW